MQEVILGIDYGHVRIGIARAEAGIAYPLTTLQKIANPSISIGKLAEIERATMLVVGLPRNLNGDDTIQTAAARAFADTLVAKGHKVVLQDEAGSSSMAEERLLASGKEYSKADIDAEAAVIILQDYLDNL